MDDKKIQEEVQQLRLSLQRAKAKLIEQNEALEQLQAMPFAYATVIAVSPAELIDKNSYKPGTQVRVLDGPQKGQLGTVKTKADSDGDVLVEYELGGGDYFKVTKRPVNIEILGTKPGSATIATEGKFLEVLLPKDKEINPGDTVTLVMQTMQIVEVASVQVAGDIAYVRRVIDETFSEADHQGSVRVVFNGKYAQSLEKGDRVVLDATATVIVRNLGKDDERFNITESTGVTWDDIGGLAEAKQLMMEAVELPHTNPDIFRFYGKKPLKGVLLYGPPGCGKTMLGKATATALARIYSGGSISQGFIYIKGPEILDRFVGVAEATVRQIFQRARKHKETHGYPAVVFIDEADAILSKRGSGISSDIERTIVPMFLTEMDGLEESGALVILATNRSDILDPAVVRDGRVDRKIKITRPTRESATEIFMLNLKRVPLNNGYSHQDLAEAGSAELFSSERVLYKVHRRDGSACDLTLGHICNGGMIAGIADQATSFAMHRDIKTKKKPEGLRKEDLTAAVDSVFKQNVDLNHSDELADFVHDYREDVVNIQRLRQAMA